MASIELSGVTKRFGKVTALDNISLEIKDKEFFVLFGPAGAGKTTILNIIAGIHMPESGVVKINGEIVNQVEPQNRDVAMVFENYALYPHLKVYDNIASPLRSPRHKKDEAYIKEAVERVAALLKIDQFLDRLPVQLSNGQRQRVALGRALVRYPNVYLMDEPLAHLDAKLRNVMRGELKMIQSNFNTTAIYVTHDFMEAMSLSDRIAVINEGSIVQVGASDEIYYLPCNEFVAQLMGDPEINLLDCEIDVSGNVYSAKFTEIDAVIELPHDADVYATLKDYGAVKLRMGLRPQNIEFSFDPADGFIQGQVYSFETIGNKSVLTVTVGGKKEVRLIAPNGLPVKLDQNIYIKPDLMQSLYFHADSSEFICRYNEAAIRALAAEKAGEE
ncbi:MAG: ABC transporter ATP-binding protein [Oscillospiraceae bacterium]|nr:ABC transporter ATP-binding protein [Oscillospiraceae bacterium]